MLDYKAGRVANSTTILRTNMVYPKVLTEMETLQRALAGQSIARFGDGELRLAVGGRAVSQDFHPKLRDELRFALRGDHGVLPCIPHMNTVKYEKTWRRYEIDKFVSLYDMQREYGSAFITRPDSAPWIDTPEYWGLVKKLWEGKDIVFVTGNEFTSLRPNQLENAAKVRTIVCPARYAYVHIDSIMERIGPLNEGQTVIMCLGATATVLAVRLHVKYKAHALDLGHIGRMMRHAGRWIGGEAVGQMSDDE